MSITKTEEHRALMRARMNKYCKERQITVLQLLQYLKISKDTWFRITSGSDSFFPAIVKIVENTNKFFEYQDFALLLEENITAIK